MHAAGDGRFERVDAVLLGDGGQSQRLVAAEVFARSFCGTIVAEHWEGIQDGESDVPFSEDNFVQVMTELVPSLWEEIVNFVLAEQQAHDDRMADSGKG
jgi:hypothetical protein